MSTASLPLAEAIASECLANPILNLRTIVQAIDDEWPIIPSVGRIGTSSNSIFAIF